MVSMVVGNFQNLHDNVMMFTSLDGHFAVSDALAQALASVRNRLLISSPWIGKGFVDLMRRTVSDNVSIFILTRPPKENYDTTFDAINSLHEIAEQHNWKLEINCISRHHPKFVVVDNTLSITGSLNPTESGIYYNLELGFIHTNLYIVKRLTDFFFEMARKGVNWEKVKQFHGIEQVDQQSVLSKIAEKYIGIFFGNGNAPLRKSTVCSLLRCQGFVERDIITVEQYLLAKGVLYEPKLDWVCLISTQD
jgi:hypothetical protein